MAGLSALIQKRSEELAKTTKPETTEVTKKYGKLIKDVIEKYAHIAINHLSAQTLKKKELSIYLQINYNEFNTEEIKIFKKAVKQNYIHRFEFEATDLNKELFKEIIHTIATNDLDSLLRSVDFRGNNVVISLLVDNKSGTEEV